MKHTNNLGYSDTFESGRRVKPSLWHADYCLLRGLADAVQQFARQHAKPGMRVVDYGCGAKPYRHFFPEKCEYIGVDTCASPYADRVVEPGAMVPLPDGTCDCILSTQVVYLIPEYTTYLRECHRLLSPEGRMLITSHGTWTHHPASGGDYYRFTQDGLRHILRKSGFEIVDIQPIVGTLGTGLHLRQLIFTHWLKRAHLGWAAHLLNVITNIRILIEDKFTPHGTRMSSPVIFSVIASPSIASPSIDPHE